MEEYVSKNNYITHNITPNLVVSYKIDKVFRPDREYPIAFETSSPLSTVISLLMGLLMLDD